jgi:hypothetical protein
MFNEQDAELQRLHKWKSPRPYTPPVLGQTALDFFTHNLTRRFEKFGKLSEVWLTLVPAPLADRTMLAAFQRGTLTVHVADSATLYELKQVMLAGLEDQLLLAGRGQGLRKISLKRGSIEQTLLPRDSDADVSAPVARRPTRGGKSATTRKPWPNKPA